MAQPQAAAVAIKVVVTSKEATAAIGRVNTALKVMEKMIASGNVAVVGMTGSFVSLAAAMSKASADGADLAKALALIKGMKLQTTITGLTAAVVKYDVAVSKAAISTKGFAWALVNLTVTATAATTALTGLVGLMTAAGTAGLAGAKGTANMGRAAGTAATGMSRAGQTAAGMAGGMAAAGTASNRAATGMSNVATATTAASNANRRGASSAAAMGGALGGAATAARGSAGAIGQQNTAVSNSYRNWDRFNDSLWEGSNRMRMAGSQAQWTGRQLAFMFTAPALIMGGIGLKSALDFERQITQLTKVYGDLGTTVEEKTQQVGKLRNYFMALSDVMGIQASQVAEIGAKWAAAGAEGSELAKMTRLTTEAMVLGNMSAEESYTSLIAVQAQYKLSAEGVYDAQGNLVKGAEGVKEVLGILNVVENQTGASMQDLTAAFQRSAATARIAGVDAAHLAAMIATLVPASGSAAKAGVALNSIMAQLGSPDTGAAKALRGLGFEIDDAAWRAKNMTERLEDIADQFALLDNQSKMDLARPLAGIFQMPKAVQMLGDIAARNGDGLSYYAKALKGAGDAADYMAKYQEELNTQLNSDPQKLKQAGIIIQNSLTKAIIPLVPHIVHLAQGIAKLTKAFSEMSPESQKMIMYGILMLAALGPLAMLFGSISILIGVFGKSLAWAGRFAAGFAFHVLGIGTRTREVAGVTQRVVPRMAMIWGAAAIGIKKIVAAMFIALRMIYLAGWAVLTLIMTIAGRTQLATFTWFQRAQTAVLARHGAARVGLTNAQNAAMTASIIAAGRTQTAAAAAGGAAATAATRSTWGRIGAFIASVFALDFIFRNLKKFATGIGTAGKQIGQAFVAGLRGQMVTVTGTFTTFFARIAMNIGAFIARIPAFFRNAGPAIGRAIMTWGPRIAGIMLRIAAVFTGPIGWAIAGLVTLIMMFPKQIWNAWKGLAKFMSQPFVWAYNIIVKVIRSLISAVTRVAVGLRKIFDSVLMDGGIPILAKPFVFGVRVIGKTLSALPRIVAAVFRAVVTLVQKMARAVREALSYLNPFARHSPSLVDNVRAGMDVVTGEYAAASQDIQGSLGSAKDAVDEFGKATSGIKIGNQNREQGETRAKIAEADPAAAQSYDKLTREMSGLKTAIDGVSAAMTRQEGVIKGLEAQVKAADKAIEDMQDELERLQKIADNVTKSLDQAQKMLDHYANAPLIGMRAMSDAIFENEMAQKALRLEIMRMEEAGGSIDDIANKMANLQGEIETLSGQRSELRNAGAGSDIIGQYDKMIEDLQKQQGALATGGVSEIEEAQKQLEELQRKGEMLDLENSLKFDPLNRQIEQMVTNLEELSFEEKVAGVQMYKAQVEQLTIAQTAANAAVEAQQEKIDAATKARDALQERLDAEQEKLQALQDQHDQMSQTLDDAQSSIDETTGALDGMESSLDSAADAALAGADALDAFGLAADSLDDYELPGGTFDSDAMMEDIDKMTEDLANQLGSMFDDIDIFGGIKKKFDEIIGWFTGLPGRIGATISGWGASVGGWFSGLGTSISTWFAGLWTNHIWPFLSALPGNLATFFMELPGHIVSAISYLIGYIVGFFIGLPGKIIAGLASLGQTLAGIFSSALDWLATNLPIYAEKVLIFFIELPETIWNLLTQTIPNKIGSVFQSALQWLATNLPIYAANMMAWFRDLPGNVINWIGNMGSTLLTKGQELWDGFTQGISNAWANVKQWAKDHIVTPFVNGVKDALGINSPSTVFAGFGGDIIQGLINGIGDMGAKLIAYVKSFFKEHVTDPVTDFFKIGSPSRLFADYGGWLAEGLAVGIDENAPMAQKAAESMAALVGSVKVGEIAAPGMAAPGMPAPAAAPAGAPANPAAGMPEAVSATANAVGTVMAGMDANLQVQLGGMQADFGLSFTGIHDDTIALVTDMQLQTAASTDMWSLDMQTKHSTMQLNTLTSTTAWSGQVQAVTTLLKDAATATTQAMVDGQITSFTMGRDNMTMLAASTRDNVSTAFGDLATNLDATMNGSIRPVMDSFGPMLDQVTTWFGDTVSNVGTQWDGIKEPVAVPARFIVDEVYNNGIKAAWNKVNTFLGLEPLEDYVAGFASGGAPGAVPVSSLSNPNKPVDVTSGGALKAASSNRDSTLFAGMRGEYVLNKKQVKQWGGIGKLEAWRQNALKGTKPMEGGGQFSVPGFAEGGDTRPGVIDNVFSQLGPYKGRAYQYGGGGDPGYDCSGWTGAVHKILLGQSPQGRIWNTEVDFGSFGYKRGKEGYWSMGVHNGGGGMNSHTAGTLDGVNFEAGGGHGTSTWGGAAAGTTNSQFENQYYLPSLGGVFKGSAGGGSGPTSKQLLDEAYRPIMDAVKAKIPTGLEGTVGQMPQAGYDKFDSETYKFLSAKAAEIDARNASMGNVAYNSTAGVEQWRGTVKEVLGAQGRNLAWDELTLAQMASESGGNPNAINDWDSNAAAGTPSKGLMQVIDTTFAAHRDGRYVNDIWDPHANIAAALNYVVSRYGGPEGVWGQGHGYDSGGVLPPGTTTAVNKTGKPEAILTNSQWGSVGSLIGTIGDFARGFRRDFSLAFSIGFGGIFRKPIKTVPTDTSGRFIGAPSGQAAGTPNVTAPTMKLAPSTINAFWSSSAAQKASWTADLVKPIEGLENVMAGMPRKLGETVVSEWPTPPPPPEPGTPAINLPPDLFQPAIGAIPTTPVPTAPGGAGSGSGGGSGTGGVPTTPVPTTPVPSGGGLTPAEQQAIEQAIAMGVKFAAEHGLELSPEFVAMLNSVAIAQATQAKNNQQPPPQSASNAQSANTQAQRAGGGSATGSSGSATTATQSGSTSNCTIYINGDLSMPNVKGGNDAATFLANLKNLAGVR